MENNFFSINDLITFCKTKKCYSFSAKNPEERIKIREIGMFSAEGSDGEQELSVTLRSCHAGKNLNQSFISEDSMKKAMPTFKGKPILGAFVQNEDTNEWDFNGHDMEFYVDENGETQVKYIEQIIGNVSEIEDPHLEYDSEQDKNYVIVKGKIFREYTKAEEILNRRKSCACSVELAINDLSYNVSENCIELNDFVFSGVTLLGEEVKPGMAGSKLTIDNYAYDGANYQEKLLDALERLNNTLSTFQIKNNTEKGVRREMNHFEELLEKYGFTAEELDFDYENMSDEQLDAAFEEFKNKKYADDDGDAGSDTGDAGETDHSDGEGTGPTEPEPSEDEDPEGGESASTEDDESKKKGENFVKNFKIEISHEDIRYALYNLLGEYEEADNEWYGIYAVYDNYFIMQGWCNGKFYKQGYAIDGENVSLDGERTEVFQMLLTESEKIAVEKLRSDYAELEEKYNELKTFKDNYDAAEQKAAKDAIFADEAYDSIRESDEFKALMNDSEKYSVEEIQNKCDLLFAASVKKAQFAAKDKKPHSLGFNFSKKEDKKASAYGNLFKKD